MASLCCQAQFPNRLPTIWHHYRRERETTVRPCPIWLHKPVPGWLSRPLAAQLKQKAQFSVFVYVCVYMIHAPYSLKKKRTPAQWSCCSLEPWLITDFPISTSPSHNTNWERSWQQNLISRCLFLIFYSNVSGVVVRVDSDRLKHICRTQITFKWITLELQPPNVLIVDFSVSDTSISFREGYCKAVCGTQTTLGRIALSLDKADVTSVSESSCLFTHRSDTERHYRLIFYVFNVPLREKTISFVCSYFKTRKWLVKPVHI